MNVDTFLVVDRLPREGENVHVVQDEADDGGEKKGEEGDENGGCGLPSGGNNLLPGGKGCTQAVAASRLLLTQRDTYDQLGEVEEDSATARDAAASSPASPGDSSPPAPVGAGPDDGASAAAVSFVGQFGSDQDEAGRVLRDALWGAGVNMPPDLCRTHPSTACGRGYVFLSRQSGQVSAVVSGGSNLLGWKEWEAAWKALNNGHCRAGADRASPPLRRDGHSQLLDRIDELLADCGCVLLQREIPEDVNRLVASRVAVLNRRRRSATDGRGENDDDAEEILVFQDVGGEDRIMDRDMMELCHYLIPNESELQRLVRRLIVNDHNTTNGFAPRAVGDLAESTAEYDDDDPVDRMTVVQMAKYLQSRCGARNILVTQGRMGSTLVSEDGQVLTHPAMPVDDVVDETGAGDCYRAAFAVAMLERKAWRRSLSSSAAASNLLQCMEFASAAGACSVERKGAVSSAPTRGQVLSKIQHYRHVMLLRRQNHLSAEETVLNIPRGDGLRLSFRGGDNQGDSATIASLQSDGNDDGYFPFLIGSRLNSMKDRPDLWDGELNSPRDYIRRQSRIRGLSCVDFNYPQHFLDWSVIEAKTALDAAGLKAGAVCLRYPARFARGAMNHPEDRIRKQAIALTIEAAQAAIDLGCKEVVVWSAFDGYDYPFQCDYLRSWDELVSSFQECCDVYPEIRFSLEFKPTDENTRFFTVPSTGAALLLVADVDRPNFGLTLDVGHMLMSGENPGQSIAMAGRSNKLFGIQLNDGYTRLAAEDGLMFGSIHPSMALEIMFQLRRFNFSGHVYFDTFPQRSDPIREAEYNIRRVKAFWRASGWIDNDRLRQVMADHDGVGALELVDEALKQM
jgi:sugar/nucleoside kinase (ribokinase family)/sugar phosphate isomerase/epimerase